MEGPAADLYRQFLLDIFHLIDCIKMPMHHSYKKAFFAAYREAFRTHLRLRNYSGDQGDTEKSTS